MSINSGTATECQLPLKEQYPELYNTHLANSAIVLIAAGQQYLVGAQTLMNWVEVQRATATGEDASALTRTSLNLAAGYGAIECMLNEVRQLCQISLGGGID